MPEWKRWRAWLRAIHRDFGYLAIGFTVIYAVSGIAQNHIEDWGDVSYAATERTVQIAPITAGEPTATAVGRVVAAAGLGEPTSVTRAGDELRLEYASGAKATAIAGQVTVQTRERRAFIGVANWLHKARGKKAWKYIADVYALFLLYLAISGIFMIKGKLGFKWRGATLIGSGVAVPVLYVMLAGGPGSQKTTEPDDRPAPALQTASTPPPADDKPVLRPLPPDDDDAPAPAPAPTKSQPCDPFTSMHGCGDARPAPAPFQPPRKPAPKEHPSDKAAETRCDPFVSPHGCKQ